MKQKLSFVLALLTVCGICTTACGSSDPAEKETLQETVSETAGNALPAVDPMFDGLTLDVQDFGGRDFRVLSKYITENEGFNNLEVYAEGENGEILNDTVFRRNTAIEERYNVRIRTDAVPEPASVIRETVYANDQTYDLVFNWLVDIGTLAGEGLFCNLYDIENIDFSGDWWNPSANDTLSINGHLYFTTSDFVLHDKQRSYLISYNKDMAEQYDIPSLTETVRNGKWTVDVMTEYCKLVASDLNNDGKMTNEDRFGLIGGSGQDVAMLALAFGNSFVSKDPNGKLILTANTERMVSSIDRILTLYDKQYSLFPEKAVGYPSEGYSYAYHIFFSGNALFYGSIVGSLKSMSAKCDFNYSVVPMPKYDEAQERYLTHVNDIALLFAVPRCAADPDFTGYMLEVLSCASQKTTLPTYYEICCKTKYSYDTDTMEMLDLAMDGIIYDVGFIYNFGGIRDMIGFETAESGKNNFASKFAKRESKIQSAIDAMIETFA